MNLKIRFSEEAFKDVDENFLWYEYQKENLGYDFLYELENTIEFIRYNPKAFIEIKKNYRKARLRVFPFAVYYTVIENTIYIVMILHQKRSVKHWKQRIKEFNKRNK